MEDIISIEPYSETHLIVKADPGIREELKEYFKIRSPGYEFSPAYRNKMWDGYEYLYKPLKPLLYVGLLGYVKKFAEDRNYTVKISDELELTEDIPDDYGYTLAESCKLPETFVLRDYQNEYIVSALRSKRSLNLSPTSSGKSLIQYLVAKHYYTQQGLKVLLIVPRASLVHQMRGDFIDYGCDPALIHCILAGAEKITDKPIVITTWQSLAKTSEDFLNSFGCILGDEGHNFTGKTLKGIMEKATSVRYRHGFSGTLKETKVHKLILEGLFGTTKKFITTRELMDRGTVADLKIKAIVLGYSNASKTELKKKQKGAEKAKKYAIEKEFLAAHDARNRFIRNIVWSLKGNNLILFDLIEKHGKQLEVLLQREGRCLHFIHGGIAVDYREKVRELVENDPEKRHDILASYGTFSTGVNLKRIDNAVLVTGGKSQIRVLQSIGRILRKGNGSDSATLIDIADDLSVNGIENYTLQHFRERIDIYGSENFDFKILNIALEQ